MDPGHAHAITDPSHAHGVYDPGHSHGAWTDAQGHHSHGFVAPQVSGVGAYAAGLFGRLVDGDVGKGTDGAGNHAHNVGVGGSGTGISIYGAGTGIVIKTGPTGISLNTSGDTEARPRNNAYLACIKY